MLHSDFYYKEKDTAIEKKTNLKQALKAKEKENGEPNMIHYCSRTTNFKLFFHPNNHLAEGHQKRTLSLWIDFDLTLTKEYTVPYLACLPTLSHATHYTWAYFHQTYIQDLERCRLHQVPPEAYHQHPSCQPSHSLSNGTKLGQALDLIEHVLIETTPAEIWSYERLNQTLFFKDLSCSALIDQGANMELQPHAAQVLRALSPFARLVICSLNWSSFFIQGALEKHGVKPQAIHCNELLFNPVTLTTTGRLHTPFVNGIDKMKWFHSNIHPTLDFSVFIGDSIQDLPCIMTADLGILYAHVDSMSTSLKKLFYETKITLVPLLEWKVYSSYFPPSSSQPFIFCSSNWKEIGTVLTQLSNDRKLQDQLKRRK